MANPTVSVMNGYVNQHISKICPCSYHNDGDNHCAHFISHVMGYSFDYTCFKETGKGSKSDAANIRVQEVFPRCGRVGTWASKPANITTGLIFLTRPANVNLSAKTMVNVRHKHIGIFIDNDVWQYKNRVRHVIWETPADFGKHYDYVSKTGFTVFYGEFPV